MQFERPVPGQSLTTTPKSAPYERPPEITDPMEALDYHLDKIDNEHDLYDKGVPYIAFKISSLSSDEWTKERIEQLFSGLF